MKRSTSGILTSHTGSLPRPQDLLGLLLAKEEGQPVDPEVFDATARRAVADLVQHQVDVGITVLNDGEQSKISYATYVKDRLAGFEGVETVRPGGVEARDFPEYASHRYQAPHLQRPYPVEGLFRGPERYRLPQSGYQGHPGRGGFYDRCLAGRHRLLPEQPLLSQ